MKTEEPGQDRQRGEETHADDEGEHHRGDELSGSSQCQARRLPGVLGFAVLERIDGFVGVGLPHGPRDLGAGLPDAQAGLPCKPVLTCTTPPLIVLILTNAG